MEKVKNITVIPPNPKYDSHIRIEQKRLNVAAYCRVSTRFEQQQENSYEAQISYYIGKIKANKNWNYVGIYAEEAEIVQKIFDLYIEGFGVYKIAKILEQEGIKTVTGKRKWHNSTIYHMLQCEKYMGDAILQKTYTIDFLSKKRVINKGYVKKYYVRNSHDPIICKEQYYQVQEELKRRRLRNSGAAMKRYSSSYPLSGLIVCGECKSNYTRVTWRNKSGKNVVWRCRERSKTGTRYCKQSPALKETMLLNLLIEIFSSIEETEICESTAFFMSTKASLRNCLPIGKARFEVSDLTKNMLNQIMEQIVVKNERKVTIFFKSGLNMDKDFIKTIK